MFRVYTSPIYRPAGDKAHTIKSFPPKKTAGLHCLQACQRLVVPRLQWPWWITNHHVSNASPYQTCVVSSIKLYWAFFEYCLSWLSFSSHWVKVFQQFEGLFELVESLLSQFGLQGLRACKVWFSLCFTGFFSVLVTLVKWATVWVEMNNKGMGSYPWWSEACSNRSKPPSCRRCGHKPN